MTQKITDGPLMESHDAYLPPSEREQFEAWWYASKYCQVPGYPEKEWQQIAWDGWQERAAHSTAPARCPLCHYQHGHAIGCENNPVDIGLKEQAARAAAPAETERLRSLLRAVLDCDDLTGWCGPVASPLYDRIDAELCSPSPK